MPTNDVEAARRPLQGGDGARQHQGYDPNQPRVPAGHHDGGRWTRTEGSGVSASARREAVVDHSKQEAWGSYVDTYRPDGTLAEQRVFNRDGSRIVSEFNARGSSDDWDERHTVVLSDGSKATFQTSGDAQEIYDGDGHLISASVWTRTDRNRCRWDNWHLLASPLLHGPSWTRREPYPLDWRYLLGS